MGRTIYFKNSPTIIGTCSCAGPKESTGAIGKFVDFKSADDMFGEKTFEKAETKMFYTAVKGVMDKLKLKDDDLDVFIAGDLLNQIVSATFTARNLDFGYLGVYNACATFTESLIVGSVLVDGGYVSKALCGTSSHFSSAERQYRYPLELGCTRPPLSQWTVTGAGACVLAKKSNGIKITCATIGKVVDFGVTDANNMGAAMAPSACDTIAKFFKDTGYLPEDFDLIVTGDLGTFGTRVVKDLLWEKGYDIRSRHVDCGELVYNIDEREYQGGSGAGCSSLVFSSYLYRKMTDGELKRILLVSTGALLSTLTTQQGESIPGIAHAVCIERQN